MIDRMKRAEDEALEWYESLRAEDPPWSDLQAEERAVAISAFNKARNAGLEAAAEVADEYSVTCGVRIRALKVVT